jgi:O-antigen ligase
VEKNWTEKWEKLKNCKVFQAFSLFIVYNIISILWTDEVQQSIIYILKYWYILPAFVIFTSFPKDKFEDILKFFIFGMLISEILSYGIFFELWTMKHGTVFDPTPFMNHLDYGIFLVFTSILFLVKFLYSDNSRDKMLFGIFFLTVSGNLFITGGRAGQLAFFITVFVIYFVYFNAKIFKSTKYSIITIAISLVLPMILSDTFVNRLGDAQNDFEKHQHSNYKSSFGNRLGAWEVAGKILSENPIFGVGNQDNIVALKKITSEVKYLNPLNWYPHFHNQYLDITSSLGILGLFIFLNIFWQIFNIQLKEADILIKVSFLSIFLIGFIAEPFLHKQFTLSIFALILGYLLLRLEKKAKNVKLKS